MADDPALATLDDADIATLETLGIRRAMTAGDYLFREGDAGYDFYVILSGAVEIVSQVDGEDRVIARHGPRRFLGELSMLTGQRAFLSGRVAEPGEVIAVPASALRRVIASQPGLGDTILAAFIARRTSLMSGAATSIRVVGSRFSPESLRLREFLSRNWIPHQWLDADRDATVEGLLREFGVGPSELPVVIASGSVLRRPAPGDLAGYLGLTASSLPDRCFDLVVVGGGPSGLAAAVYGSSEGLKTLLLESFLVGGQAGTSSRIENYLGFPTGVSGAELTGRAMVQAEKFGTHVTSPCAATSLRMEAGHLVIRLSDGTDVGARAVIVASGARYKRLDVARIEEFEGNGVYYAATEMEARLCAAAPVVVVGGGNSAGQAGLFLASAGSQVTLVIRGGDVNKGMSRYLVDRIVAHTRIDLRTSTRIAGLDGDASLASVRITGEHGEETLRSVALFSFIGAEPASDWLSGCAALDEHGFVLTDRALGEEQLDGRWQAVGRRPLPFETSFPGLFAVGDVRSGSMKRVAAAVGEGSAAVRSVHEYLGFDH